MTSEDSSNPGVEAVLVKEVGAQIAQDGSGKPALLLQFKSLVDETFTFAMDYDSGLDLAKLLAKKYAEAEAGSE